jgi:hypothetical protein
MPAMHEPPASPGLVPAPAALGPDTQPWVQALQQAAGASFRALYIYGSALTPRFDAGVSDINLLLVLGDLPFERLDAIAAAVRERTPTPMTSPRWMPLVLTETQIRGSLDVFPAEFHDLAARRALLAGEDVLSGLVISDANLRHQIEYELRSKIVGLRQAYLLAGGAPGLPQRLLVQSAGGLATVLRLLLRLRRLDAPEDNDALAAAVARAFDVDAGSLGAPFAARRQPDADEATARARFAAHLVALETLITAVDAFPTA